MKKQIVRVILISLGLFGGWISAQTKPVSTHKFVDAEAETILKAVQTKISACSTISIDFTIHTIKEEKVIEEISGKIQIKGEKYALETPTQEVYCNTVHVWNYIVQQQEVTVSSYNTEDEDVFLNPSVLMKNYQKLFRAKFVREETHKGVLLQVIDLTPLKTAAYYRVRLFVDKNKKQIVKTTLYQKDGISYTYFVDKYIVNQKIDDNKFVFDQSKHPKVELIDLR